MWSLQFARTMFTMFYTTTLIAFTSLQLMGLNQASSLSNEDALTNAHYFFYQNSEYPKDCKDIQRQCSTQDSSGVYIIKPDGFQEPFEVFCDNKIDSGGWTVIERRGEGIVNFDRNWTHYRHGFGFLSTDFFIGNERLAYLTNQATYELLIEAELENGCSFYTSYKDFRITDEFGVYTLKSVGTYDSNASQCLSDCPGNVFFVNRCTEMCTCTNNRLDKCIPVSCDVNAVCDGTGRCSCNEGYEGDGLTCTYITTTIETTTPPVYTDCKDAFDDGRTQDGVFKIRPNGWTGEAFDVFCEMDDGGGWTVFQRRKDDSQSFYQNWTMYKEGFGDLNENFWLGNEKLYYLTHQKNYQLRLDIVTSDGTELGAEYTEFQIQDESDKYRMNKLGSRTAIGGGYAGYALSYNRGKQFSTYDSDNDACGTYNCAEKHRSGWWHSDNWCNRCYGTDCHLFEYSTSCYTGCTWENLNGIYDGGDGERISTASSRGCDGASCGCVDLCAACGGGCSSGNCYGGTCLIDYCNPTFVEMKIRPS